MKARRFDFYPDDWLAGTVSLDMVERGVYITAISAMYSHGGSVKKEELRRLCRMHGNAYKTVICNLVRLGKLIEKGDDFVNKRVRNESEKASKRLRNAVKNGRKGGRPSNKTNWLENPEVSEALKLPSPSPSPSPLRKKVPPPPPAGGVSANEEFSEWWAECPRKVGKDAAARKYLIARRSTDAETLLLAMRRYRETVAGKEVQYVQHPATWLHQGRWKDEEVPAANGHDSSPTAPPIIKPEYAEWLQKLEEEQRH